MRLFLVSYRSHTPLSFLFRYHLSAAVKKNLERYTCVCNTKSFLDDVKLATAKLRNIGSKKWGGKKIKLYVSLNRLICEYFWDCKFPRKIEGEHKKQT